MTTLMWEARAAEGRIEGLLAFVCAHADASAQVYQSVQDSSVHDAEVRVVVIDPAGRGIPDVPRELIARPPHEWPFEPVVRHS